ncbi:MAG TPA: CHAD domain-containing protein [Anaerolineaceae bacterium]|nr:CHAD domain-containing protein [Anaerolineaceae bacterium]
MPQQATDTVCVYGARIIKRHLESLKAQIEGVKAAEDIEAIHQMRVASRRMRSALAIFRSCFRSPLYKSILKDVRAVTGSLGTARDLDVQLAYLAEQAIKFDTPKLSPGIKRLRLRLAQKRDSVQPNVNAAMKQFIVDDVIAKLNQWAEPLLAETEAVYLYSPSLYLLGFDNISQRLNDLEAKDTVIRDPANVGELHAMRICAKRLRYTLEAFEDLYAGQLKPYLSAVKKIQEMLGEVHDLDVWIDMIPTFIEEEQARIVAYFGHSGPLRRLMPGLEAFKHHQLENRAAKYVEFINEWDRQKTSGIWTQLRTLINTPIDLEAAVKAATKITEDRPSDDLLDE